MRMYINNLHDLVIGRMLDNKVLTVEIGCAEWKKSFPNLTNYRIEVTSPDGTVYFADTTMKNDMLIWAINQNDTAKCGDGMFQIVATGEDGDRKSSDHPKLTIRDIMPGTAQEIVPDYAKPWTDKVSADADRAEVALNNARQASDSARISAMNAELASADAHKAVDDVENISKSLCSLDANYTKEIPAGADFDDYIKPGNYVVVSGKIASQVANIPRELSGRLTVYTTTENKYVVQEYVTNSSAPYVYRRTSISGTWNDWHLIATMYDVGEIAKTRLALSAYDAEELADYTDFDGLITPGNYRVTSVASAKTMQHIPRNLSGRLTVYTSSAEKYVIQEYVTNSTETHVYRRNKISDAWSPWHRIAMTEDALVLASKYATKVEDNTDFDSLTTPGNYHVPTVETAETIINIPRKIDGRLTVFSSSEEERLIQAYITNGAIPEIYYRAKDANAWNPWYRVATTDEVERLNHALDDVIVGTENEFAELSKDVDGRFALSDTDTEEIPAGADFDKYTVPGNYAVVSGKIAGQITNMPCALSGRLTVYTTTEAKYVVQEYRANSTIPQIYHRTNLSGTWNNWRRVALAEEVEDAAVYAADAIITPSNYTEYFTSYDDIPINSVYNIASGVELENSPPGNKTLNSEDARLEYMPGTVVTLSGSRDNSAIRSRFQIFMSSTTMIPQSIMCFRSAYTQGGALYWSKWQKLTEVSALTASNIVIRKATADRFFTDLDDAPINSIYQLDLDCDEGTLEHHPNPGQSCVLVTLGYSYVSRHGMVQMCFGLGGATKMYYRYGYINGPEDYRWTDWQRTATMTDVDALEKQINVLAAQVEKNAERLADTAPAITCEASGSLVTITDAAARPAVGLVTTIEPVQEGEGDPSPDNMRPISVWDSVTAQRTGKNVITYPYLSDSMLRRGVTYTVQTDGTILADGTATSNANIDIMDDYLPAGTYYLTGCPAGGSGKTYRLQANATGVGNLTYDYGSGGKFALTKPAKVNVYFIVFSGATVTGITIKPMLSTVTTAYAPYQGQTLTAALPESFAGGQIDLISGEGKAVYIRKVFDGTETWTKDGGAADEKKYYALKAYETHRFAPESGMCSHYPNATIVSGNTVIGYHAANSSDGSAKIIIRPDMAVFQTVEAWKEYLAQQYDAGTPVTVVYKLADPDTVRVEPQQLNLLKGVNHIWSDCGDTALTYIADTKMYIDRKFSDLQNAILAQGANI